MNDKVKIRLEPAGIELQVNKGTPYQDILHEYGVEFPCGGRKRCMKCRIKVLEGFIEMDEEQKVLMREKGLDENFRLGCKSIANFDAVLELPQWESIILADETEFDLKPLEGYGIAIDLGTTTLVSQLLDLKTGHILDVKTALNPQARYGADIISRIEYAIRENTPGDRPLTISSELPIKGSVLLKNLIREVLGKMINEMVSRRKTELRKIILVGNTVMQHLFCGLDVLPLSFYPFESSCLGEQRFKAADLGWELDESTDIIFMPSIGGFVGSDILAGIYATRMHQSVDPFALIDLGTNGEIALGNRDGIICASTAAGPAFEGTNIEMGMRASFGAISAVKFQDGRLKCKVIGNEIPRGICGSGLLDAVSVLLQQGRIDLFGNIADRNERIILENPVYLSQKDIREFQLAKGAVAAGMEILLKLKGLGFSDLHKIYIAGAFGNYISTESLIRTGMLESDGERVIKMGNTALIGAKMFLFSEISDIQDTLRLIKHIGLESDPQFQDIFAGKMFF